MSHITMRRPTLRTLEKQCAEWNNRYPVGTEIQYHPVIGEPAYRLRRTRTEAYVLSGHTAVLFAEGETGCLCLDACEPVQIRSSK